MKHPLLKSAMTPFPYAVQLDSPLLSARKMMVEHKVPWVILPDDEKQFDQYPDEGIEDWHRNRGLYDKL